MLRINGYEYVYELNIYCKTRVRLTLHIDKYQDVIHIDAYRYNLIHTLNLDIQVHTKLHINIYIQVLY